MVRRDIELEYLIEDERLAIQGLRRVIERWEDKVTKHKNNITRAEVELRFVRSIIGTSD